MNKLNKLISKVLGQNSNKPIIDEFEYYPESSSYAGGSLSNSNVLIITSLSSSNDIEQEANKEGCHVSKIEIDDDSLSIEMIKETQKKLIGPYMHIFNVLKVSDADILRNPDPVRNLYQWLQTESEYLIDTEQIATICVAVVRESSNSEMVISDAIEGMIKGLSDALGKHNILVNGILVDRGVPIENVGKWMIFLSSKYGNILAGNFLHLSCEYTRGK